MPPQDSIRFHPSYRPGRDAWGRDPAKIQPCVTEYFRVEGPEAHEVAVGPVHAGVIEPGHFRFQCHGEEVLHLEIELGYQHRGVERAMLGGPNKRTVHYAEMLAGNVEGLKSRGELFKDLLLFRAAEARLRQAQGALVLECGAGCSSGE